MKATLTFALTDKGLKLHNIKLTKRKINGFGARDRHANNRPNFANIIILITIIMKL